MKTVKQIVGEIGDVIYHGIDHEQHLYKKINDLLTDFVQEIETEVIGEDDGERPLDYIDKAFGVTKVMVTSGSDRTRNELRQEQRSKLQQILKDQKEEV